MTTKGGDSLRGQWDPEVPRLEKEDLLSPHPPAHRAHGPLTLPRGFQTLFIYKI